MVVGRERRWSKNIKTNGCPRAEQGNTAALQVYSVMALSKTHCGFRPQPDMGRQRMRGFHQSLATMAVSGFRS